MHQHARWAGLVTVLTAVPGCGPAAAGDAAARARIDAESDVVFARAEAVAREQPTIELEGAQKLIDASAVDARPVELRAAIEARAPQEEASSVERPLDATTAAAARAAEAAELARRVPGAKRDGMVALPAGRFTPAHASVPVHVGVFELDRTEVTAAAYAKCVAAGACTRSDEERFCNGGAPGKGNHPINCIDWPQAVAYCQWAGKRLPTDAEWEWAARGGDRASPYPWGVESPAARACWGRWSQQLGTCAVGITPRGDAPGRIHDLAGNVWEWTATEGVIARFDGDRPIPENPALRARSQRGGSWASEFGEAVGVDQRQTMEPTTRGPTIGFRCAR